MALRSSCAASRKSAEVAADVPPRCQPGRQSWCDSRAQRHRTMGNSAVSVNRKGCDEGSNAASLYQPRHHRIPVNADSEDGADGCFPFQLLIDRTPISTVFEPVDCQCSICGMDQPDFGNAGTLVERDFDALIVAGGAW